MTKTIFEKIIEREIPAQIVYEDDIVIAIVDPAPIALGHTLVIPKTVSETFLDMKPEEVGHYFMIIQKVSNAVRASLKADGINILLNNGVGAGQEVFHTHTHIIPRFPSDSLSLDAGTPHTTYSSPAEMEEYADKIKAYLS